MKVDSFTTNSGESSASSASCNPRTLQFKFQLTYFLHISCNITVVSLKFNSTKFKIVNTNKFAASHNYFLNAALELQSTNIYFYIFVFILICDFFLIVLFSFSLSAWRVFYLFCFNLYI